MHPPLRTYFRETDAPDGRSTAVDWLASLLCAQSGIVVGVGRHDVMETLLQALLQRESLPDLPALVERLRQPDSEDLARDVVETMTTNETLFFRDHKPFDHLVAHSLQQAAARPPGQPVRIWSAGASSGQEAYSVAMIAAENPALLGGRPVRILGTDIATRPIERAQAGIYTQFEVQRGLPARRLVRHFDPLGNGWRIRPPLREMCHFGIGNLLHDPAPLGEFDIIFCRNVLMYFSEATKRSVLATLAQHLAPAGWLYLGASETVAELCPALKQSERGQQFYQLAG